MIIESGLIFIAKGIASFALNKGLNTIVDSFKDRDEFENELSKVIWISIQTFEARFPIESQDGKFPFYDSQALLDVLLKFRLFQEEAFDGSTIYAELDNNPNILRPTNEQISNFLEIFSNEINKHNKLKAFEIEKTYKERIFIIDEKLDKIFDSFQLNIIEVVPLLQDEFKAEIEECYIEIKALKFKTALARLKSIEERMERNPKHVSNKLRADLLFYQALCFESIDDEMNANKNFILAYKRSPENIKYKSRACLAYYKLKDDKYKELKAAIEQRDDYNLEVWYIKFQESTDKIFFLLNEVPKNVLEIPRFKRLIFNLNLILKFIDFYKLIDNLDMKLEGELPETINYDNIYHWLFIRNIISIDYFQKEPIMYSIVPVVDNDRWKYFYELSTIISNAICISEFSDTLNSIHFFRYWLELETEKKDIEKLLDAYEKLPIKDPLYTLLMANSLQKYDNVQRGLDFIESHNELVDYNIVLLKIFCQTQIPNSAVDVQDLFGCPSGIDSFCIAQICRYLEPLLKTDRVDIDEVRTCIQNAQYTNEDYHKLLSLLVQSAIADSPILIEEINSLSEKLRQEPELNEHIAFILFESGYYEECIQYIKSYLDETKPSQDIAIYIEALNKHRKDKQNELLRILEVWRKSFPFNPYFLKIEIELRQILDDEESVYQITKYAIAHLPNDELFYTRYIVALYQLQYDDELASQIPIIQSFKFQKAEHALNVAGILLHKQYFQESLDILYETAKNPDNVSARMAYFTATLQYPPNFFIDYDVVKEGVYVRFEINGETQQELIQVHSGNTLIEQSLGKTKGETFTIKSALSNIMKTVRVVRIMNKYLALFDEICAQTNSPFSNLPMESISIKDNNIESFQKQIIELFGQDQEEHKNHFDNNIREYNHYSISFTELVMGNFKGNFIEAYAYLTSQQSDGFLIFPIPLIKQFVVFDDYKIVLDFTSAILFYQLEDKLNLPFAKYIVPKSFIHVVEKIIVEAKESSRSNMSIHIIENRVVPISFSDDYHQSRISFFQKFLNWIKVHTKQITPEEKIDMIRPLYDEGKVELPFECMVDTVFLGQRDGYIILSDDLSYRKLLPGISDKIMSPEMYLIDKFGDKKKEIYEYLLDQKYVGLTIDDQILYDAYITQNKKGHEHIFQYALRNIAFRDTFSSVQIKQVVEFLKKIALNPLIAEEKYLIDATNVVLMAIKVMNASSQIYELGNQIELQFALMGNYLILTRKALLDAMKIFRPRTI